jgi:hypothetical protein
MPALLVAVAGSVIWAGWSLAGSQKTAGRISVTSATETSVPSDPAEVPPGPADRPLQITIVPEPEGYPPGQPVKIQLLFSDIGPETITINGFPPEIEIISREWKTVCSSGAGSGSFQLKPGETKTFILTWNQQDEDGNQVRPGLYRPEGENIIYVRDESQRTTKVNFGSTWFIIRYPQGAMEKTIEPDLTQTVDGVTIRLEKVEMSSEGMTVRCFAVLPYNTSSSDPSAWAEYSFDGVTRDAGHSGYGAQGDGYRLVWGPESALLDPVPGDAGELTFAITEFRGLKGPWVFRIPLE